MRIITDGNVYELSEDDYWLFIAKLDDIFVPFRGTQTWHLHTKRNQFE